MTGNRHTGIIHFHSNHSYDSNLKAAKILNQAVGLGLSFLILTDHDSLSGSKRLKELAVKRDLQLEIPLAAEYATNYGDIIAAFIKEEIKTRDFDELVEATKEQGGITLLPHPYSNHINIDCVAAQIDMIEIFNGRQNPEKDELARQLAIKHNKPTYLSSDAHLASNLGDVIVTVERTINLKCDLLNNEISCTATIKASRRDIMTTRFIRMIKKKEYGKLIKLPYYIIREILRAAK